MHGSEMLAWNLSYAESLNVAGVPASGMIPKHIISILDRHGLIVGAVELKKSFEVALLELAPAEKAASQCGPCENNVVPARKAARALLQRS